MTGLKLFASQLLQDSFASLSFHMLIVFPPLLGTPSDLLVGTKWGKKYFSSTFVRPLLRQVQECVLLGSNIDLYLSSPSDPAPAGVHSAHSLSKRKTNEAQTSSGAKQWTGLMVATSGYGTVLSVVVSVKAHVSASHPSDRKFSGKNLSFAASKYQKFGYVSNGMIVVNILQNLYIVDFFYQEGWYVRTIDITHDHFGLYLAWGGAAWIPSMYTLQAHLVYCPVDLTRTTALIVAPIGILGNCVIWGKKLFVITAHYTTSNGKPHTSLLLCSGFWGIPRLLRKRPSRAAEAWEK
ncbi:ergosterol biosynthesis ERG4/ERG24 family-domain-containing protein [Mycena sanguinolenta]|nr:ergosterol biosynthesis ERG4/ERG24 family-domain-containing protein [Mycena sanguinolenta]